MPDFNEHRKSLTDKAKKAVKGFGDVGGHLVQGYYGLRSMNDDANIKQHSRMADAGDEIKNRKSFIKAPDNHMTRKMLAASDNRDKIDKELSASKKYHDDKHQEMGERRESLKKQAGSIGAKVARAAHAFNPLDTVADIGEAKKGADGIPGAIGDAVSSIAPAAKAASKFKSVAPAAKTALQRAATYLGRKTAGEMTEEAVRAIKNATSK